MHLWCHCSPRLSVPTCHHGGAAAHAALQPWPLAATGRAQNQHPTAASSLLQCWGGSPSKSPCSTTSPPSVLHVTLSVLYLTREACSGAKKQQSWSKLIVKTPRRLWPAPDPSTHIPESLHTHKHPHTRDTSFCHLGFIKLLGKNSIPKNKISLACNYIYSNNLDRQTKNTAWHFIQTLRSLLNKLQKLIPLIFTLLTVTETRFACKLFKVLKSSNSCSADIPLQGLSLLLENTRRRHNSQSVLPSWLILSGSDCHLPFSLPNVCAAVILPTWLLAKIEMCIKNFISLVKSKPNLQEKEKEAWHLCFTSLIDMKKPWKSNSFVDRPQQWNLAKKN